MPARSRGGNEEMGGYAEGKGWIHPIGASSTRSGSG